VDRVAADSTCPAAADSPAVVDIGLVGSMVVVAGSARCSSLALVVGRWVGGMDRRLDGRVEGRWEEGPSPAVVVSMTKTTGKGKEIRKGVRICSTSWSECL